MGTDEHHGDAAEPGVKRASASHLDQAGRHRQTEHHVGGEEGPGQQSAGPDQVPHGLGAHVVSSREARGRSGSGQLACELLTLDERLGVVVVVLGTAEVDVVDEDVVDAVDEDVVELDVVEAEALAVDGAVGALVEDD